MRKKIPIWLFFLALFVIALAGFIEDNYGTDYEGCYNQEKFRADSLQKKIDSCIMIEKLYAE